MPAQREIIQPLDNVSAQFVSDTQGIAVLNIAIASLPAGISASGTVNAGIDKFKIDHIICNSTGPSIETFRLELATDVSFGNTKIYDDNTLLSGTWDEDLPIQPIPVLTLDNNLYVRLTNLSATNTYSNIDLRIYIRRAVD